MDPAGGFFQMGSTVGVELGIRFEDVIDAAFEPRQLGIGDGLAILGMPLSPIARLASIFRYDRCKLRRRLLMAGLRFV